MNDSAQQLYAEAMGYTYAAALRVAAQIRVADHLTDGPRTAAELGEATGTDPAGLRRVLRLLVARDVFAEDEDGRFRLTAKGDALRSDAPVPARSGILMFTDRMFWTVTHEVATIIGDPGASFEAVFGMPLDDYFAERPETEELFYDGMEKVSDAEEPQVAEAYDFPPGATVVDVGGRFGGLLLAVLRSDPGLSGVLLDKEPLLARHRLDVPEVAGRWTAVAGDFFTEVPAGDVLLVKRILHNWNDEDSVRILRCCRRAVKPGGRVLVIDAIIPAGSEAHPSKEMDFMMLANLIGRERTADELDRLFTAAGLRLTRVIPTASVMSIAEAVPR